MMNTKIKKSFYMFILFVSLSLAFWTVFRTFAMSFACPLIIEAALAYIMKKDRMSKDVSGPYLIAALIGTAGANLIIMCIV